MASTVRCTCSHVVAVLAIGVQPHCYVIKVFTMTLLSSLPLSLGLPSWAGSEPLMALVAVTMLICGWQLNRLLVVRVRVVHVCEKEIDTWTRVVMEHPVPS